MRKSLKALIALSALAVGMAVAPALYAHESPGSMMGDGGMMGGGMMGMMDEMDAMMESCNKMMQGSMDGQGPGVPNEQWRDADPDRPDQQG